MSALVPITIRQGDASYELVRNEQGEPLVKDLDLAEWLGFSRDRKIRELVERWMNELGEVRPIAGQTSERGGRPGRGYYLTEEQALFIATRSETPRAVAVTKTMIQVFMLARRGQLPPNSYTSADLDDLVSRVVRKVVAECALALAQTTLPRLPPQKQKLLKAPDMAALLGMSERTFFRRLSERPELLEHRIGTRWPASALPEVKKSLALGRAFRRRWQAARQNDHRDPARPPGYLSG